MHNKLIRALRAAGSLRILPVADSALLVTRKVGGICIDGPLDEIGLQTFVQLACFASHAPGGTSATVPLRHIPYLGRLRGQGLPIQRPLFGRLGSGRCAVAIVDEHESQIPGSLDGVRRIWRLRFDYQPGMSPSDREFILPYTMNPSLLARRCDITMSAPPDDTRRVRVLFAGGWRHSWYAKRDFIADLFGKLTRAEIVTHVSGLDGVRCVEGSTWHHELAGPVSLIVADKDVAGVSESEWLNVVRTADFLICPPGAIMPLCYNIVEALACGTIPITNYAEWLTPSLTDGKNCLAFDTLECLADQVARARNMSEADVRRMRLEARMFYEQHLDLRAAYGRLFSRGEGEFVIHALDERISRLPSMLPRDPA